MELRWYAFAVMLILFFSDVVLSFVLKHSPPAPVVQRMLGDIEQRCHDGRRCVVEMKTLTDFAWDRLVIFQEGSSPGKVSDGLGFSYENETDLRRAMVFALNSGIIHDETLPYEVEKPSLLSFDLGKENVCRAFSPDGAVFEVKKELSDGRAFYLLKPLTETSGTKSPAGCAG